MADELLPVGLQGKSKRMVEVATDEVAEPVNIAASISTMLNLATVPDADKVTLTASGAGSDFNSDGMKVPTANKALRYDIDVNLSGEPDKLFREGQLSFEIDTEFLTADYTPAVAKYPVSYTCGYLQKNTDGTIEQYIRNSAASSAKISVAADGRVLCNW